METLTNESGSTIATANRKVQLDSEDFYLTEHLSRREAGIVGPLDRSNAALVRAEQAVSIFGEGADECDRAELLSKLAAVAEGARITAAFMRRSVKDRDSDYLRAEALSHHTVTLAKRVDEFDLGRLEGLNREHPLESAKGRYATRAH